MTTWTPHQPAGLSGLTSRQREVLGLIAAGRTNPEIAGMLGISLAGAKWHVREVITKLGVENREDAAEIWREEHSLPRRLTRFLAGFGGFGALKVAAGSAAAAGVAAAGIGSMVVVQDMRANEVFTATAPQVLSAAQPANQPQVESALASAAGLFSQDEAKAVAIQLAMAELETYFVPRKATFDGRPFDASDLRVVSARFIPQAGRVEFRIPQSTWPFGDGRDVWAFELAARGFDSPEFGSELAMSVVIEDGGVTLLSRNIVWPESDAPGVAHYEPLTERVGTIVATDGREFPLAARYNRSFWSLDVGQYDDKGALLGGSGNPVVPGDGRHSSGELFGTSAWTAMGYGHLHGAVGDNVVRIEAITEDGRSATVLPQTPPASSLFPYRVFAVAFPGASWVVAARAYDAAGEVVGAVNLSDHVWLDHDHVGPE